MEQEIVVKRIMWELTNQNLVALDLFNRVAPYFGQAYAAGYDFGKKRHQKGKAVVQMTLRGQYIHVYNSTLEAAAAVGVHYDNIRQACRGKQHTSKGYKWKYLGSL